jgi:glycerol-3-phosphate dehydrogenase
MHRKHQLEWINQIEDWDFVVIGGGASGLGAALDATARGFKTLLVDAYDFAKGTSSRSTKLVHGGVRYLARGDIGLVREALKERGLLAENAAHLFSNQSFIIPNYSWWGGFYYQIGLTLYDLLSGKLSLGHTKYHNKKNTLIRLPSIKPDRLQSGVEYKDGLFDDARLAVNLAQTLVDHGGCLLNYAKVTDLQKDETGRIKGVMVKDMLSQKEYVIRSKVVINATGVFANDILNMDDPKHGKFIVPSQGIHIVLDQSFLPGGHALMIPKTPDGRVLFAIPWHQKIVVGTTDTLVDHPELEPRALDSEIDFVLETTGRFLIRKPARSDVLSVFAGLRPLAAPRKEGKSTKEVSRSHKIIISSSGLITIIGGKWTTYRRMGQDLIDKAIKAHGLRHEKCRTLHLPVHGNVPGFEIDRTDHLNVYGSDRQAVCRLQEENPLYSKRIHPQHVYSVAEIIWAVRQEMAQTVEDVLARRIRLLFLDARAAIDCAPLVAEIMAAEMGYDKEWISRQTDEFTSLAKQYLLTDYSPNI